MVVALPGQSRPALSTATTRPESGHKATHARTDFTASSFRHEMSDHGSASCQGPPGGLQRSRYNFCTASAARRIASPGGCREAMTDGRVTAAGLGCCRSGRCLISRCRSIRGLAYVVGNCCVPPPSVDDRRLVGLSRRCVVDPCAYADSSSALRGENTTLSEGPVRTAKVSRSDWAYAGRNWSLRSDIKA